MAMYYVDFDITSHTDGHSSVAGAAYILREKFYDELAGEWRDYRNAHTYETVFASGTRLPIDAPAEWNDPETLWNASELFNPSANGRTARRMICAFPDEFTDQQCIDCAEAIISFFVCDGMAVTYALHKNKEPNRKGHLNKHLHLNLTTNPCNENGFLKKGKTGYFVKDTKGNEFLVDAATIAEYPYRYSKLFKYRNSDGDEEWLTKNEAAVRGDDWVRVNKYPKKRKIRATDWDDTEKLLQWRKDIASTINDYLRWNGYDARVSHESYEARGIDKIPTIYEGKAGWQREEKWRAKCEAEGIPYTPKTKRRKYNMEVEEINKQKEAEKQRTRENETRTNDEVNRNNDLEKLAQLRKQKRREKEEENKRTRKKQREAAQIERMAVDEITDAIEDSIENSDKIGRDII